MAHEEGAGVWRGASRGEPGQDDDLVGDRSETETIPDVFRDGVAEHGRTYHAFDAGQYLLPSDRSEQERELLKHEMIFRLCGKLVYAPVESMMKRGGDVLDLGTGTGAWITDLGDLYRKTNFYGIDLSPIQPEMVAPNVNFYVENMENENWIVPKQSFDYIHIREVIGCVNNRRALYKRIYERLKPGGYVEVQGFHYHPFSQDGTVTDATPHALRDFYFYLQQGSIAIIPGWDTHSIIYADADLRRAGFEDVTVDTADCPIGGWANDPELRECGEDMHQVIHDALYALSLKPFLQGLGWKEIQLQMFLVDVRKHLEDPRFHACLKFYAVHARKPM